jgi:hypothetical protein
MYPLVMGEQIATPAREEPRTSQTPPTAWQMPTLVVGLLAGASLGPSLFILVNYFEPKADTLLSLAIGALVALAICLVVATITAYLVLPRLFSNARGTLTAVVEDLAHASQAHAQGRTDAALAHLGRAAHEGVAWYSAGTTRRFVLQAGLALLISFGGIVGSVLLLSQNALLRDQNKKIDKQVELLDDQNKKIDKQVELLAEQNNKIEQQTTIADAQKRSAFVTEMFSILQEVAKETAKDGWASSLPRELVTRIAVLTLSAVPYRYQSRVPPQDEPESVVLSPERGQLLIALARMNVPLSSVTTFGGKFDYADLRGSDLRLIDLSGLDFPGCDFSYSKMSDARFRNSKLLGVTMKGVVASRTDFGRATFWDVVFEGGLYAGANFDDASFDSVTFKEGYLGLSTFDGVKYRDLSFTNARVQKDSPLPEGLPWPDEIREKYKSEPSPEDEPGMFILNHQFEGESK